MDNGSAFAMSPFVQDNLLVLILLGMCALLAALVIVGMVIGARNKRRRTIAEHEEEKRIEELRADGVEIRNAGEESLAGTPPTPAPHDPPHTAPAERAADAQERVPEPARVHETAPMTPASPPPPPAHVPQAEAPDPAPTSLADEPIAAAAPLNASPASVAADEPAAQHTDYGSAPVTQLKGLGPRIAARLEEFGIASIGQLAALDDRQASDLDARLGPFTGRMARDRWVEQARLLTAGDRAGYEAQFGKLG